MTERKEHYDEDSDLGLSSKFSEDLNTLFKPHLSVPPEVDRAILDQVHRHFSRRYRPRRLLRWPARRTAGWAASIAAAAAVIIFAFIFNIAREPAAEMAREATQDTAKKHALYTTRKPAPSLASSVIAEDRVDIDQNGRVDILDAFKLAQHVESKSTDRAETNLSLRKQGWDINGDGLVNRDDVDLVASAAVRLDKGVL